MRKIFYFLIIALFLVSCEEAQKPGAKKPWLRLIYGKIYLWYFLLVQ